MDGASKLIKTHKVTGKRLLLIRSNSLVSTLYLLDEKGNKILDKNKYGKTLLDIEGNKRYKTAICRNDNLI